MRWAGVVACIGGLVMAMMAMDAAVHGRWSEVLMGAVGAMTALAGMAWLQSRFADELEDVNRLVRAQVDERVGQVGQSGQSGFFVSAGGTITIRPREVVGAGLERRVGRVHDVPAGSRGGTLGADTAARGEGSQELDGQSDLEAARIHASEHSGVEVRDGGGGDQGVWSEFLAPPKQSKLEVRPEAWVPGDGHRWFEFSGGQMPSAAAGRDVVYITQLERSMRVFDDMAPRVGEAVVWDPEERAERGGSPIVAWRFYNGR